MAAAAIATLTIPDERYTWVSGNKYTIIGNLTITASPATYTTGGIACNLYSPLVKATLTPVRVYIDGESGYTYKYIPGSDASQGLLQIYVQDAIAYNPLAQIVGGDTIPAGVSGDTILLEAVFNGML